MSSEIRLEVIGEETPGRAPAEGSAALQLSADSLLTLRLAISTPDPAGLEALRHARRSILREEWTLGREPDEPSLESAIFSATEVSWTVPLTQRQRCRERLVELETRANRALRDLRRI